MTLTKRNIPTSHAEAVALLNGRESRNISHNGRIFRDGADVVLRLHATNIVTYRADGSLVLNTGGWHTRTTQAWINCALRGTGFAVWTVKGALAVHRNGAPSVYLDGMVSLAEAA
jgi:hypothetical protein